MYKLTKYSLTIIDDYIIYVWCETFRYAQMSSLVALYKNYI